METSVARRYYSSARWPRYSASVWPSQRSPSHSLARAGAKARAAAAGLSASKRNWINIFARPMLAPLLQVSGRLATAHSLFLSTHDVFRGVPACFVCSSLWNESREWRHRICDGSGPAAAETLWHLSERLLQGRRGLPHANERQGSQRESTRGDIICSYCQNPSSWWYECRMCVYVCWQFPSQNEEMLLNFVAWEQGLRRNLTENMWKLNPSELAGSWYA